MTNDDLRILATAIPTLEALRAFAAGDYAPWKAVFSTQEEHRQFLLQLSDAIRTVAGAFAASVGAWKAIASVPPPKPEEPPDGALELAVAQSDGAMQQVDALCQHVNTLLDAVNRSRSYLDKISPSAVPASVFSIVPDQHAVARIWPSIQRMLLACTAAAEKHQAAECVPGSQGKEDTILAGLLPATGTYLDIGAGSPTSCSNTWTLYQQGWRGLLVEPQPRYAITLNLYRPGDFVLPVAVMDYNGFTPLRLADGCSSVVPSWDIAEHGVIVVPCMTLASVLHLYPQYAACEFCSIDVEGAEHLLLNAVDWNVFRPGVICIEYIEYHPTHIGQDLSPRWSHHLTDHGYTEVARTDSNIIYTRTAT